MNDEHVRLSKFLSQVLRHRPEKAGVRLDRAGWASVADLVKGCAEVGVVMSRTDLAALVAGTDKCRYEMSADGSRVRATQGHSVDIKLGYKPKRPPEILYHGTATQNRSGILREGLLRQRRHHVHLSAEAKTAEEVGTRHGAALVLRVLAGKMHRSGHKFFEAPNGVWLTERVPAEFLQES